MSFNPKAAVVGVLLLSFSLGMLASSALDAALKKLGISDIDIIVLGKTA